MAAAANLCLPLHMVFSQCASGFKLLSSYKMPVTELGPTLPQYDPILTNYVRKDPISK